MANVFLVLVAALISGLLATLVTIWQRNRYEKHMTRIRLFQQLLGTRHALLPGRHHATTNEVFASTFNQVPVVFHGRPSALSAYKALHEAILDPRVGSETKTQRLLEFYRSLAKDVGLDMAPLGDEYLLKAFQIQTPPAEQLDLQALELKVISGIPHLLAVFTFGPPTEQDSRAVFIPIDMVARIGAALLEIAEASRTRAQNLGTLGGSIPIPTLLPDFHDRLAARLQRNL